MTPDGIADLREGVSSTLSYAHVGRPFDAWVFANFREDYDEAGCCEADTVEESVARGELRAFYARQWAETLGNG